MIRSRKCDFHNGIEYLEEVVVGKRRKEENEKISETLRKEEVNIKEQDERVTSHTKGTK